METSQFSRRGMLRGGAAAVGAAVVAPTLLSACSDGDDDVAATADPTPQDTVAPSQETVAPTTTAASDVVELTQEALQGADPSAVGPKTIGVVAFFDTPEPFLRYMNGMRDEAPDWEFQVFGAGGDPGEAASGWENLVQAGVDAIAWTGFTFEDLRPQIQASAADGLPLLSILGTWGQGVSGHIGANETAAGVGLGSFVVDTAAARGASSGNYATVTIKTNAPIEQRRAGFEARLLTSNYTNVADLDLDAANIAASAASLMETLLQQYGEGELDAVFYPWDDPGRAALEAARALGRSDVMIAATDGGVDTLTAIRNGDPIVTTGFNFTTLGNAAARQFASVFDGGTMEGRVMYMDSPIVFADNVGTERYFPGSNFLTTFTPY